MNQDFVILDCIRSYWEWYKCPPTIRAICFMADVNSTSTVSKRLKLLEQSGLILPRRKNQRRAIIPANIRITFE